MGLNPFLSFLINNSQLILGDFLGFVASFGLQIIMDCLAKPDLNIKIGEIGDGQRDGKPKHRFLQVMVENKKSKILSRRIAFSCRAKLIYRGKQKELLMLDGRWSSKKQPIAQTVVENKLVAVPDLPNIYIISKEDLPPGAINASQIAVGLKHDGEPGFYGFNDVSYGFDDWKNPSSLIKQKECEVEIVVYSSDHSWAKKFKILNPSSNIDDFELTNA